MGSRIAKLFAIKIFCRGLICVANFIPPGNGACLVSYFSDKKLSGLVKPVTKIVTGGLRTTKVALFVV